ncbi:MAG: filamentous hemagglutinin family outer membrane protein [Proteobacteria bacterium]|nr:filamentous hemagglutinin family outer membrane protein [Pseudomonadota bacterium]
MQNTKSLCPLLRDLIVETAQETHNESHFKSETESGFSASLIGGISYGTSSLEQSAAGQRVTQVASTLSGGDIALSSGRDTTISASNVLADRDLTILAGRNVDILAAANSEAVQNQSKSESTSIGLTPGASGRFTVYGKTSASEDSTGSATTQSTTLLSANSGDLTVRAGLDQATQGTGTGNITTQGADLLAGGTITLSGRAIDLQAVSNETRSHSVAESSSLTIGSALAGPLGSKITAVAIWGQSHFRSSGQTGFVFVSSRTPNHSDPYKLQKGKGARLGLVRTACPEPSPARQARTLRSAAAEHWCCPAVLESSP